MAKRRATKSKSRLRRDSAAVGRSRRRIFLPGWRDIAVRVKRETAQDNISIVAAGVAY